METGTQSNNPSFIKTFSRSQLASAAATAADWGLLFSLVELLHVWYVVAVAAGAAAGAVTNFLINRYWSFEAADQEWRTQAWRYAQVSVLSLLANTGGTWAMTEFLHVHYGLSVLVVSALVGFLINYPLQKHYVFRPA